MATALLLSAIAIPLLTLPAPARADEATRVSGLDNPWWNEDWHFRVPVVVRAAIASSTAPSGIFPMRIEHYPLEVEIDFRELLVASGWLLDGESLSGFTLDNHSIRVVGATTGGSLEELPSRFDPVWNSEAGVPTAYDPQIHPLGTVTWVNSVPIEEGKQATFWIYFDSLENGRKPLPDYHEFLPDNTPTSRAVLQGFLDGAYGVSRGTRLFGYAEGSPGTSVTTEVVGLYDDTNVQFREYQDGVANPLPRVTTKVGRGGLFQTRLAVGPVEITADKPIVAFNRVSLGGAAFYPSVDGSLLGSEFYVSPRGFGGAGAPNQIAFSPFTEATVSVCTVDSSGESCGASFKVPQYAAVPFRMDTSPKPTHIKAVDPRNSPALILVKSVGGMVAYPSITGSALGRAFMAYYSESIPPALGAGAVTEGKIRLLSSGRSVGERTVPALSPEPTPILTSQKGTLVFVAKDNFTFWMREAANRPGSIAPAMGEAGRHFLLHLPSTATLTLVAFNDNTAIEARALPSGSALSFGAVDGGGIREISGADQGAAVWEIRASKPIAAILHDGYDPNTLSYGMPFVGALPRPLASMGRLEWGSRLLDLRGPSIQFVEPNTTVKIPLEAINLGRRVDGSDLPDTIRLALGSSFSPPAGWRVNLAPATLEGVPSGSAGHAQLVVDVPASASGGSVVEIPILATSAANPRVSDRLTVSVEPVFHYETALSFDDGSTTQYQPISSTGNARFAILVSNRGNANDTITLETSRPFSGWTANLSLRQATLRAGETRTVALNLTAPAGTVGFQPLYVTAKSRGSPIQKQILAVAVVATDSDVVFTGERDEALVLPGEPAYFNLTLENRGNPTTVALNSSGFLPPGWTSAVRFRTPGNATWLTDPTLPLAGRGDAEGRDKVQVQLIVTPPAGATALTRVPLEVVAKPPIKGSKGEARFSATTVVARDHRLAAVLGAGLETMTVTNTGNGPATFRFAISDLKPGWAVDLPPQVSNLPTGANVTVPISITLPPDIGAGAQKLTLVALFDDGARVPLDLGLDLRPRSRIELRLGLSDVSLYAATATEVRGVLRNVGNVPESPRLLLDGDPRVAARFQPSDPAPLAPGQALPFSAVLTVPLGVQPEEIRLTVRAETGSTGVLLDEKPLLLRVLPLDLRFDGSPFENAVLDGRDRHVEARVVNRGPIPIHNVTVTAYEEVGSAWIAVGNVTLRTVPPAQGGAAAEPRLVAFDWTTAREGSRVKLAIDPLRTLDILDRTVAEGVTGPSEKRVPGGGAPVPLVALTLAACLLARAAARRWRT